MSRDRRQYKIYGPTHFRATWAKFLELCEREGQSASELIRIWVEGYVARKDPGNPQRPLTAYVPGHEDQAALERSEILQKLRSLAVYYGGQLPNRRILEELKARGVPSKRRVAMAQALVHDLMKLGVQIIY